MPIGEYIDGCYRRLPVDRTNAKGLRSAGHTGIEPLREVDNRVSDNGQPKKIDAILLQVKSMNPNLDQTKMPTLGT
jgi:hypothetical protein